MQVLKFGGTSLADADAISRVTDIVKNAVELDRTILVCSAINKATDTLIRIGTLAECRDESYHGLIDSLQEKHNEIIRKIIPREKRESTLRSCTALFDSLRSISNGVFLLGELSSTSLDAIQAFGELLSTGILVQKFSSMGISTKWVDSREIVLTHNEAGKNVVEKQKTFVNLRQMLESNPVTSLFVMPGFIASDEKGRTTTLGRGGSDYSASLFAAGCNARILEIWTDVTGMMTTNPKVVKEARTIGNISYRAALELSHFGAKVIYPPTIQPVISEGIPIYIRNTFDSCKKGTLIERNPPKSKEQFIGISNSDNIALLSLEGSGMVGVPGFSSRLFGTLSQNDINIILITQASSVHTMCIAVSESDAEKAKEAADKCFAYEISLGKLNPLKIEKGFSIVCLVGDDILNQSGTTGRMLAALGRHGISVRATAQGSSERNISVIISSQDVNSALQHIHEEFFSRYSIRETNLFIAGYGNVGRALVKLIKDNGDSIATRYGKRLRICGLSNSRRYVVSKEGLDLSDPEALLKQGGSATDNSYFNTLALLSLENSIFVDCTASPDIACRYTSLFKSGYSVVACNKIAFSAPFREYREMKASALKERAELKYETTAGAALPILESVARSLNSGDGIIKIEAVLSGTLNYIFSTYGVSRGLTFAEVVRKAQESGYTEHDPRLDLSGRDLLRKLLIIAREAEVALEEEDVSLVPAIGPKYFKGDLDEFYSLLSKNEPYFAEAFSAAESRGLRQRYVASLVRDESAPKGYRARISLEEVAPDHPLFHLRGTDNSALITTEFYPSPLVIQGAGAGALQTASGLINDILKV